MKRRLPNLADNERGALLELKKRLKEKFGSKFKKVILFGSKARGGSEPDSDIDVLIILSDSGWLTRLAVYHICFEVDLEYDTVTSCIVRGVEYFQRRKKVWMPLLENVIKEGVLI
jgi:predicted nucleotidyltransferase